MAKGFLAIVLHAHLPFVRHPEQEDFLEERWLFEAISETYIPLLERFNHLNEEGIDFRLTISLSPPLISMLTDSLLQDRYIGFLSKMINLCEREIERTAHQPEFHSLAVMYANKYRNDFDCFVHKYEKNLINAFSKLQKTGKVEIITCAATHGFLPLLNLTPESVKAQISVAVQIFEKYFGSKPKGMWLPECGYIPDLEKYLIENGVDYVLIESHGILFANPRPVYGTFAPIVTPRGVVGFGRDIESSKQVWSSDVGYPGDHDYRDFYRDIGHDLDFNYINPYILSDGKRINTGIKYYKITGKTQHKLPYNPSTASAKTEQHALDFLSNRLKHIEFLENNMDKPPLFVCPYDAELFGHWWYEGPEWLYNLFKKLDKIPEELSPITPGEYINKFPLIQVASPCSSSWGANGYNEVWLNKSNDWIYNHLQKAAQRMVEITNDNPNVGEGLLKDALNQAARELLLAQSSDWAFIMKADTMVEYAKKRTNDHLSRFTKIYYDIKENNLDEKWLREVEWKDNIFPDIDYKVYKSIR
ncbi:MAG: glycoside hydrolase family 57 protein [Deltaproteobacteria bacterium]